MEMDMEMNPNEKFISFQKYSRSVGYNLT